MGKNVLDQKEIERLVELFDDEDIGYVCLNESSFFGINLKGIKEKFSDFLKSRKKKE